MASEPLAMWTVYDHPADHPEGYIARLFEVTAEGAVPTGHTMSGQLEWIRMFMQSQGLACLTRNPDDDPVIVETWL